MTSKSGFKFALLTFVCLYCHTFQTYGQDVSTAHQYSQDELEKLRNELREVARHVVELEMNPFPAGFIYIQYHGTPEPIKLWPHSSWQEVTTNFAGLFFRAGGGDAAQFGVTQPENSPRITNVDRRLYDGSICGSIGHVSLPVGSTSEYIVTGSGVPWCNNRYPLVDITFRTSGSEVRPKNQAVRMWQVTHHQ